MLRGWMHQYGGAGEGQVRGAFARAEFRLSSSDECAIQDGAVAGNASEAAGEGAAVPDLHERGKGHSRIRG